MFELSFFMHKRTVEEGVVPKSNPIIEKIYNGTSYPLLKWGQKHSCIYTGRICKNNFSENYRELFKH